MKINKISLYNFNSYEGHNEFDFESRDKSKNIVLIGGKNGAGKTSLFTAIKIALYVFYDSYSKNCSNCEAREICPIRINYELLANNEIRNGIVSTIIESIVKNKLIISTRTLLNFIYEILVNENYFDQGSLEPRKIPDKLTQIQYINSLLPSTLFIGKVHQNY